MILAEQILKGNRTALGQGITLLESTLPEHEEKAQKLLTTCLSHSGKSIRIGVTGVPGVDYIFIVNGESLNQNNFVNLSDSVINANTR